MPPTFSERGLGAPRRHRFRPCSKLSGCSTSRLPTTGGPPTRARGASSGTIDWLYYETPDCNMVSVTMKDGSERGRQTICGLDLFYYGSVASVVLSNHVVTGVSGDDPDQPGYLESHDPETGDVQWRWYVVPQKKGEVAVTAPIRAALEAFITVGGGQRHDGRGSDCSPRRPTFNMSHTLLPRLRIGRASRSVRRRPDLFGLNSPRHRAVSGHCLFGHGRQHRQSKAESGSAAGSRLHPHVAAVIQH